MSLLNNAIDFTRDEQGNIDCNHFITFDATHRGRFWNTRFFDTVVSVLENKREGKECNRIYIQKGEHGDLAYQFCQNEDMLIVYVPGPLFYIEENMLSFSSFQIICLPAGEKDIHDQAQQYFQNLLAALDSLDDFEYRILTRKSEKTAKCQNIQN